MRGLLSMQKINSSYLLKVLPRACLIFLVCLSLVALSSYTAPKAQAEAFTLTLTSAFIMLVIAVMGTLGVTLASSSNDDAVEYMSAAFGSFLHNVKGFSGSIAEFLSSIGIGAIGLLGAPIHGAISIGKLAYDLIAEFCTWFFSENDVVSGGSDVGDPPSVNYPSILVSYGSSSSFNLSTDQSFPWSNKILSATTYFFYFANGAYITWNNSGSANINRLYLYNSSGSIVASASSNTNSVYNWGAPAIWIYNDNVRITFRQFASSSQTGAGWQSSRIEIPISDFYSVVNAEQPSSSGGFVVSPSDAVITPPSIAVGQSYNVPAEGVTDTSTLEEAIPAAIAPLTTTGGLTNTGTVAGSAVQSEFEWLYEDTQSIRNNTNPHFDFIPSTLGFDFSIWHYVTEMMASVNSAIALFGTFIQNMPPAILVFPFGVFALCITVALFRRFLS